MEKRFIRALSKSTNLNKITSSGSVNDIELDIISDEFRSKSNALSFWMCETEDEKMEALKAIIFSGKNIQAGTYIILSETQINELNLEVINNEGITAYNQTTNKHVDIVIKSYQVLGEVLEDMIVQLKDSSYSLKLNRTCTNQIVIDAIKNNEISAHKISKESGLQRSLESLYHKNKITEELYQNLYIQMKE